MKTRKKSRKVPTIANRMTLRQGGSTSPEVEFYQLKSGRCHLFWFSYDQEGPTHDTIAVFYCTDWKKAMERAKAEYAAFLKETGILA